MVKRRRPARGAGACRVVLLALVLVPAEAALVAPFLPLLPGGTVSNLWVSTAAGSADGTGATDGAGLTARFDYPSSLALSTDAPGLLFIGQYGGKSVRSMNTTPPYFVATFAGSAEGVWGNASSNGVGTAANFNSVGGIAADNAGSLFVADSGNCAIRRIHVSTASVTHFAGTTGSCTANAINSLG